MKEFLKYVFATITGIILLGAFFFVISLISLVGMLASDSGSTSVEEGSVFVLNLSGSLDERASEDTPLDQLMGMSAGKMGLDECLSAIKKAQENDKIKGILIQAGSLISDSPATQETLRRALAEFKKSGKWIVAYGDTYLQGAYYIASVADRIYMNPTGSVDWKGMGARPRYMKGLYEKVGIKYQLAKVGKYKSAVEMNTADGMSEADREQRTVMIQNIWNLRVKEVAESRKTTVEALNKLADDSLVCMADPADLVKAKLIDQLAWPEDVKADIKKRLGLDDDDDIPQLTLAQMSGVKSKKKDKGDEVAVYYAYGAIYDTDMSTLTGTHCIAGDQTAKDLLKLADDDDVKAVVIRVNSPGGSANASEQINHAIKKIKEKKKPVVVSMGGYAASGGYYISAPADYIFAEASTVTGSIGIYGMIPNYNGLTQKLGLKFDEVATNKYASWEENLLMSNDNSDIMRNIENHVVRGYDLFLTRVAEGRKMKKEQVHEIAQGRVWTATDALKIKLIDKIGDIDDAVEKAAQLAKMDEYHQTTYPAPKPWYEQLLEDETSSGSILDSKMQTIFGPLYQTVMEMKAMTPKKNWIQASIDFKL